MVVNETEYRICYEDTDAGGIVYYGNYLRYLERGRTEYMRERGLSVKTLMDEGLVFPVVHVSVDYRFPAFYDDVIVVKSEISKVGRTSVDFKHSIHNRETDKLLVEGRVTLVCLGMDMRPRRIPDKVRALVPDSD